MNWLAAAAPIAGDLLGGIFGSRASKKEAARDRAFQLQTMQNQIQWRVEDANKAGVHPLFALGASPYQSMGSGGDGGGSIISDAAGRLGQNISRAVESMRSRKERGIAAAQALQTYKSQQALITAQIDRENAQSAYIRAQTAKLQADQVPPPRPDGGRNVTGMPDPRFDPRPQRTVVESANSPGVEPGPITTVTFARNDDGGLYPVPSEDLHNRTEDTPMDWDFLFRNRLAPSAMLHGVRPPSTRDHALPEGATEWRWSAVRQAFYPFDRRSWRFLIDGRWERSIVAVGGRAFVGVVALVVVV